MANFVNLKGKLLTFKDPDIADFETVVFVPRGRGRSYFAKSLDDALEVNCETPSAEE